MPVELLHSIGRRLEGRAPHVVDLQDARRAAVAVTLAPGPEDLEVLLIRRAEHEGDPWSGHMAFPGGHHDPTDPTLAATAERETLEEVGIDLARHGRLVSRLDEVQAQARGSALDMVVTPFLFALDEPLATNIDRTEVAAAVWIPLRVFREDRYHGTTAIARGDFRAEFPAFLYEGHTVWGMTYRMIRDFLRAALPEESSLGDGDRRRR
jgi:8-oxo-dGTP pyrophosphatase MutT (NUDIX family)